MAGITDFYARPLHDLRISVIDRCNFRCPYCMPADLFTEDYEFVRRDQWLDFDEIVRLAHIFARLGVRKLRLTGGEPLLRPNVSSLVGMLSGIDGIEDIALTTNAVLLPRHAQDLKDAGLDRLTVSLDTLDPDVFRRMSGGRGEIDEVLRGLEAATRAGFSGIKINCVVQRGVNDHTVPELVEHFRGTGHIVRFIEFMDVGTRNDWNLESVVTSNELRERIASRWPLEPLPPRTAGETSSRYRFLDGGGEIGFISSVSEPFCGGCSRARLSCDGELFSCLFATNGLNIRALLGVDDDQIQHRLEKWWDARRDRYSAERSSITVKTDKIEMYRMGG